MKTNSNDIALFILSAISLILFNLFCIYLKDEKEIVLGLGILSALFDSIVIGSTLKRKILNNKISNLLLIACINSIVSLIIISILFYKLQNLYSHD